MYIRIYVLFEDPLLVWLCGGGGSGGTMAGLGHEGREFLTVSYERGTPVRRGGGYDGRVGARGERVSTPRARKERNPLHGCGAQSTFAVKLAAPSTFAVKLAAPSTFGVEVAAPLESALGGGAPHIGKVAGAAKVVNFARRAATRLVTCRYGDEIELLYKR